jgi:hypothetical protein
MPPLDGSRAVVEAQLAADVAEIALESPRVNLALSEREPGPALGRARAELRRAERRLV